MKAETLSVEGAERGVISAPEIMRGMLVDPRNELGTACEPPLPASGLRAAWEGRKAFESGNQQEEVMIVFFAFRLFVSVGGSGSFGWRLQFVFGSNPVPSGCPLEVDKRSSFHSAVQRRRG